MYKAQVKFSNTHHINKTQMAGQIPAITDTQRCEQDNFLCTTLALTEPFKNLHLIWIRMSIFLVGLDRVVNIHKTYNIHIPEV